MVSTNQKDWSKFVPYVAFCYNASTHTSTGFSPHFIMCGQEARWNIDFIVGNIKPSQTTLHEYTADLINLLDTAHNLVREIIHTSAQNTSNWYNRRVREESFEIGDTVRVYNPQSKPGLARKLQSFYKDVATVVKRLNDVTYVVSCTAWRPD